MGLEQGAIHEQHISYILGGDYFKYQGCFDAENAIRNSIGDTSQAYTPNKCIARCRSLVGDNYKYAGVSVRAVSNPFSF